MSDSVRPHRRQPARLCHPWDSPGKNTGAGCHFLLQCMKVKGENEVAQSWLTLSEPMDCSLPGSSVHGIFQARVLEWVAIVFSEGCLECAVFLTCWRHRTKFAIFVFIPRLRSIWGQNPWPTRADDEPQHELRVRVPANQSEAFPLCQVGNSVFLTVTCACEPSAWGTEQHRVARDTCS